MYNLTIKFHLLKDVVCLCAHASMTCHKKNGALQGAGVVLGIRDPKVLLVLRVRGLQLRLPSAGPIYFNLYQNVCYNDRCEIQDFARKVIDSARACYAGTPVWQVPVKISENFGLALELELSGYR